jgi:hypothetical protein
MSPRYPGAADALQVGYSGGLAPLFLEAAHEDVVRHLLLFRLLGAELLKLSSLPLLLLLPPESCCTCHKPIPTNSGPYAPP